jgi:hypothetical protein
VGEALLRSDFLADRPARAPAAAPPPVNVPTSTATSAEVSPISPAALPGRGSAQGVTQSAQRPFQRPVTPTRCSQASGQLQRPGSGVTRGGSAGHAAGSLTAQVGSMRTGLTAQAAVMLSESGLTMRERAQRAAQKMSAADDTKAADYVRAFGARKELPRTPKRSAQ